MLYQYQLLMLQEETYAHNDPKAPLDTAQSKTLLSPSGSKEKECGILMFTYVGYIKVCDSTFPIPAHTNTVIRGSSCFLRIEEP